MALEAGRVGLRFSLKVLSVWRTGPRFWVKLIEDRGQLKVKKELLDFNSSWVKEALLKEADFFKWGNTLADGRLKEALPRLLELVETEGEVWYTREFAKGHFQNQEPSLFLLKKTFYDNVSPRMVVDFLKRLHRASKNLPSFLTAHFSNYNLAGFEHFTAWQKLPLEVLSPAERGRIKKFLAEERTGFNSYQNVLCHYEFYGTHLLLTEEKKLIIIYWENVGWGDVTHDLVTLYLRAYSRPDWQEELVDRFREGLRSTFPFEDLFRVELLLQSLGNIRYFLATREPLEIKEREKALRFFLGQLKGILAKVN